MQQSPNPSQAPSPGDAELLALADQCVKCGLCLPHCPTYQLSRNEGESPRGRIALIQGWISGALVASPRFDAHLDHCLECRACEGVCPSLVPFGRLMDAARARRVAALPRWRRLARRTWLGILSSARIMDQAAALATVYRRTGIARLAERLGIRRWSRLQSLHRLALSLPTYRTFTATGSATPDLRLFVGCLSGVAQAAGLQAAVRVLRALGYRVGLATEPGCCGAIHRHNGFPAAADRLLAQQAAALGGLPVVGLASACVAELRRHPDLVRSNELCAFLADARWPEEIALAPLARQVLVHEPCTHRLLLAGRRDVQQLLSRIPGLRVADLPDNGVCCGAAGTYLLDQPELSQALLRAKIDHLRRLAPDILVTTNPGCALHLAAGIREADLAIEVCHPVELIARQLP